MEMHHGEENGDGVGDQNGERDGDEERRKQIVERRWRKRNVSEN
jgi:hypothetical protein